MGTNQRFWWHFVQLVIAAGLGMFALAMVWPMVWPGVNGTLEVGLLVMVTNMAIGTTIWTFVKRRGWAPAVEMAVAMYVAFIALFVPYWLGALSANDVMIWGHVLMLPCMLVAMLRRREEYSSSSVSRSGGYVESGQTRGDNDDRPGTPPRRAGTVGATDGG